MNARAVALRVLIACQKNGAWADAALSAALEREAPGPSDAALASRIVYGVLQNRILLDYYLAAYCTQRIDHLQQPLPDILRIGAYQILFLERVPPRAAVSEAVELAKASGRGAAAGLVNAVLRQLAQHKAQLPPLPQDTAERLSVATSHPRWLTERMLSLLGAAEAEAFLRADNTVPPVTIQVNPLRNTPDKLMAELRDAGIDARPHPWAPDCLDLTGAGDLTALPAFSRGAFFVQDAAARLVTLVAELRPETSVLDVCAAPGGKSFSAAFAMKNRGRMVSCDLHESKRERIRDGAERLGISIIETRTADARVYRDEWESAFDAVLCDVPCSGLGVVRKKPDIRYKNPLSFVGLPTLQGAILANASRYLKPGGVLVYSTCTVLPEENEGVTDTFLSEHSTFRYEPFALPVTATDGRVTLYPHRHGTDGFYIAKMRKEA